MECNVEEKIESLNADLRRQVELLAAANAELDAFSYSVSHDLRTPLRHINGFVRMLEENAHGVLDEAGQRYLKKISDAATTMNTLIDALLSLSRIGRGELHPTAVDMDELLQGVIVELSADLNGRNIVWKKSPLPRVHADAAMLHVVLVNLISNALKFTRPQATAEIEIGALNEGADGVVFFVRDNGVGFDPSYASNKLFGVFQRLHSAEKFEGIGVGLAQVRRIVTRHGGKTWAEGKVDDGATFYFSLPPG